MNSNLIYKNLKNIKSFEADIQGANLILFQGRNGAGKTTAGRELIELIAAKSNTPELLTRGAEKGFKQVTIPDKDGNIVTLSCEFDAEGNVKFQCITHEGKKVTQVGKIREIMGMVTVLSVDDFFRMAQTAKGKRDIQEQLIYKLLPESERKKVIDIDKQLTTDSDLYKSIAQIKEDLKSKNSVLKFAELSEEDKLLLESVKELEELISNCVILITEDEKWKDINANKDIELKLAKQAIEEAENNLQDVENWYVAEMARIKQAYEERKASINIKLEKAKETVNNTVISEHKYTEEEVTKAKKDIEEAKGYYNKVEVVITKKNNIETLKNEIGPLQTSLISKEKEKDELKAKRIAILQSLQLHESLTFDEDTFFIDGFEVSSNQLSESKVMLILIDLLCRKELNENEIIYVGPVDRLDIENMRTAVKICQSHHKVPIFEKISDDTELTLTIHI